MYIMTSTVTFLPIFVAAVLISLDEYNSIKETERIISTPRLSGSLDEGLDELKKGKTVSVDIDEL